MKAVSVYSDAKSHEDLKRALARRGDIELCRSFDDYPDPQLLARVVRAWAPAIVFMDIRHPQGDVLNCMLTTDFPEVRRVAIHTAQLPEVFRRVLDLGMRQLVSPPFKAQVFDPALDAVLEDIERNPVARKNSASISAFLPAKAGSGASTLAAEATWAAAEDPEARVLLADFDRYSGITAFRFGVDAVYTLQDALVRSLEIDEEYWRGLVRQVRNIDLLVSRPGEIVENTSERFVEPLLHFARRNYTTVHLDLPDALDSFSLAALHQADQIFVVTTPELVSLRLAKLKMDTLRKADLGGRAALLLNRFHRRSELTLKEIEQAVGVNVFATFPCVYASVSKGLRDAKPSPELAGSARALLGKPVERKTPLAKPGRFIERFFVDPARA